MQVAGCCDNDKHADHMQPSIAVKRVYTDTGE